MHINCSLHSGRGNGLSSDHVTESVESRVADSLVETIKVDARLSLYTSLGHNLYGSLKVLSVSSLSAQHNTISSIQNSVGNIRALGTSGTGIDNHGLKHLSGSDNGLSCNVGLTDHHLLCQEDLLGRNLHTKISTSNHDSVSLIKDIIVVLKTLQVLNLTDDLDILSLLSKNLTDLGNIAGLTHKGGGNEVNSMLHTPVLDIIDILLSQSGKVDNNTRQVHVLTLSDGAIVLNTARNLTSSDIGSEDSKNKRSVGNKDGLTRCDRLGHGRVRASKLAAVSLE
mmetsp:Transcript_20105/g.29970  ORF Transcript_20105/g.29970 Transcript_20105/m.29970 type:complete len:282 (-) Transcript_20105:421-1266(-)